MKKHRYHPIKGWHIVLMLLGAVAAVQSWIWSYDILSSLFGMWTGVLLATMVTVVEIYFLMQFILTWHPVWLLGVLPGFIISIAGSYGNFQMNYEQNVEKSVAYQRKEAEINTYTSDRDAALNAAQEYDKTKQPWYAKRKRAEALESQNKIDRGQEELKTMTDQGYGSKNALFRSIARHADISTLDSAERSHLALGLFVELFMLACTIIGTHAKKTGYTWVKGNDNDYNVSWDEDGNVIYTKAIPKEKRPDTPKPEPRPTPPRPPIPVTAQGQGGNGVRPTPPAQSPMKNEFGFRPSTKEPEPEKKIEVGSASSSSGSGKDFSNAGVEARRQEKERKKRKLMQLIENGPEFTTKTALADALGVSTETLRTYLTELQNEGKIHMPNLHKF